MEHTERLLVLLAFIAVLGIGTQWLAWRAGLPAILLLLAAGVIAGPVTGIIVPETLFGDLFSPIVSLSVSLILFEGGLSLRIAELRSSWRSLAGLLTIGVFTTWIGATQAAVWLLDLPYSIALVLGAVLVVTGPTVIGPLLRDIRPERRVGAIARWEGIVIDPLGAMLAVLVFEAADSIREAQYGSATWNALTGLVSMTVVGVTVGLVIAGLLIVMLQRFQVPDHLQNAVTLMLVVAAFAAAEVLHQEAGLLTVTVMGLVLANQRQVAIQRIVEFKESVTVLLISMLFVLLTARMSLESLTSLTWRGPAFAAVLLIVRMAAVWLSTIGSGLSLPERLFLGCLAPRGIVAAAVASVFALRLGEAGAILAPATFTAETAPFQYFVSHTDPGLIEGVRKGRREEFAVFDWKEEPPDPQAEIRFAQCRLNHELKRSGRHRAMHIFYRELIALRKENPALAFSHRERMDVQLLGSGHAVAMLRRATGHDVCVVLNFEEEAGPATMRLPAGTWVNRLDSADPRWYGPGSPAPERVESSGEATLELAGSCVLVLVRDG